MTTKTHTAPLLQLTDPGGSVFPPDLYGYAAVEAAAQLVTNWVACTPPLSAADQAADIDDVIAVLRRWQATLTPAAPIVHRFDFRGQALCGSGNDQDGDAPASHDPAEVTCAACRAKQEAL